MTNPRSSFNSILLKPDIWFLIVYPLSLLGFITFVGVSVLLFQLIGEPGGQSKTDLANAINYGDLRWQDAIWGLALFIPHSLLACWIYFKAGRRKYFCDGLELRVCRGRRVELIVDCSKIHSLTPVAYGFWDFFWDYFGPSYLPGFVLEVRTEVGGYKTVELPGILVWGQRRMHDGGTAFANMIFCSPRFESGTWKGTVQN